MTDAATSRTAPITVKAKCQKLQLNWRVTATTEAAEHPWSLGQVVVDGIEVITVLVNRLMVQSTHMAQSPTTTTMRNG